MRGILAGGVLLGRGVHPARADRDPRREHDDRRADAGHAAVLWSVGSYGRAGCPAIRTGRRPCGSAPWSVDGLPGHAAPVAAAVAAAMGGGRLVGRRRLRHGSGHSLRLGPGDAAVAGGGAGRQRVRHPDRRLRARRRGHRGDGARACAGSRVGRCDARRPTRCCGCVGGRRGRRPSLSPDACGPRRSLGQEACDASARRTLTGWGLADANAVGMKEIRCPCPACHPSRPAARPSRSPPSGLMLAGCAQESTATSSSAPQPRPRRRSATAASAAPAVGRARLVRSADARRVLEGEPHPPDARAR